MTTCYPATTSGWKPEGRNPRHTPLSPMTVPAQNQIDGVVRLDLVKDIGRVCQQQRKAMIHARWETSKTGPVKGWIIDADDQQLSPCH